MVSGVRTLFPGKKQSMSITIYSATGCVRCRVVREFLNEHGLPFQDYDALSEGKEAFRSFYQKNRRKISRGPEGVEFPIYCDNGVIRQGLPAVTAYLIGGPALDGFFKPGTLHGQWLDGIYISDGPPACGADLLETLAYLKKQNFKIRIDTNGLNADLLASILERGLADRVVMDVKGPLHLYDLILQRPVDPADIEKSIALISKCSDYGFVTTIGPIPRPTGEPTQISYITPAEVAQTAELIKKAAGDNRQPYGLRFIDPKASGSENLYTPEALPQNVHFRYRSEARRHQFKTEILKN
jgi:pyruvate-formate lyase-activating enzyme/glutaredoxin